MLDQPANRDLSDPAQSSRRPGPGHRAPNRPKKPEEASDAPGKDSPKRKGAIVNRRGPSEIDRAIRMSQALSGRSGVRSDKKMVEGATSRGTVVRIDRAKGFGFLIDAAGEQRFFHRSAVLDGGFSSLKEQQIVEFEAHGDDRGARAIKVRPADGPVPSGKSPQRVPSSPKAPKANGWRSDLMPFRSGSVPPNPRKRI